MYVSSNGFLDFVRCDPDRVASEAGLAANVRIAGFWTDLTTAGAAAAGEDLYITSDAKYIVVRWKAEDALTHAAVEFEIVLRDSGQIEMHYGGLGAGLTPVVGVSAGTGAHYRLNGSTAAQLSGKGLIYRSGLPRGLTIDRDTGAITGTPTESGWFSPAFIVTDGAVTTAQRRLDGGRRWVAPANAAALMGLMATLVPAAGGESSCLSYDSSLQPPA